MKSYSSLAILMLLAIPGIGHAENLEFKIAMENLPGIDEVQAGEVELGISILESQQAAPGETAFNNRGVLRVHYGDFVGASEDFEKARPENVSNYMRSIRESDPRLIAVSNTQSLEGLRLRLDEGSYRQPQKLSSATVENVMN